MCKSRYRLSPLATLVLYTYIANLLFMDRGVLSAEIYRIKSNKGAGLGINSFEAGAIGSSFIAGFLVFGPIFARLSQSFHSEYLMSIGLLIWCGAIFATAISRTFIFLLLSRAVTGIGEASFLCLATPCLMEIAPANKKNSWIGVFFTVQVVGFALGQNYGSAISNLLGDWYYPFIFEPFAMIPAVLLLLIVYKDPRFVMKPENTGNTESFPMQFKIIMSNPVFIMTVLGVSAFTFTLAGYAFWVNFI